MFEPDKPAGVIFHVAAILLLVAASGWGIWQAVHSAIGPVFLLYLLPALISIALVPILGYRLYSLLGAYYHLERDGMRLRWGLRIEDIPMGAVQWVSSLADLEHRPPMPWVWWPGAILGVRRLPDGSSLEYLASGTRNMILIATPGQVYAISPRQPQAFLDAYQRYTEMGSLSPVQARSIHPAFLIARVWRLRSARVLLLAGLALNLLLLTWVSTAIPSRSSVILGFATGGEPLPTVRLLLLPILSGTFYLFDSILGLFFYRGMIEPPAMEMESAQEIDFRVEPGRPRTRSARAWSQFVKWLGQSFTYLRESIQIVPGSYLAHVLWASGVATPTLFLLAVFFILRATG